jgi:Flp pilus assembly protein TadD
MAAVLAPSSTLVPLKVLVVDHRAYTGSLGAAWVAAGALATPGRAPLAAAALIVMTARAVLEQRTLSNDESAWAAAVERNPDAPEAQLGLGLARLHRGDHARARGHFRRVTELAPADPRGWSNLAAALAGERRFAEALAPMQRAVALSPTDSRMLSNLGSLQAQAQRMDLAERTFERAAALSPPAPQALLNLAAIRLSREDAAGAAPLLARAEGLRLPPEQRAQLVRLKDELAALQQRPLSP